MNPFPDRATLESVLDLAARAPSSGNLQPWLWRVDGSALHLHADWRRQAGGSPTDRRDVLLGCGAVLDHCVVALGAGGWLPRVRRFPDGGREGPLAILEVTEQPPEAGYQELADAASRRRTDRRRYRAGAIPPATLELLYIRAARLGLELAAVPRSRWVRHQDGSVTLRFPDVAADSDIAADSDDDAVLLVLGTRQDNDEMRLRAGEALSHLMLTATAMGLASCPLTEALNDMRSRLALACEVFDGEAHPQTLIRLGHPPADDAPQPAIERRPVGEITTRTG
jgi:nitroreductase